MKINTIPPKRLAETITSAATTFQLNDILGFDGVALSAAIVGDVMYGSFQDTTGTVLELFKVDTTTIASASITMSKRGLQFNEDGTETEVAGNKRLWVKNQTIVNLGTDVPGLLARFVKDVDAQTIGGVKTFTSIPVLPASDPTTSNQATRKAYVDTFVPQTYLDTDGTLAANSDSRVATQKATKTYAVAKTGDTMTGALILNTSSPSTALQAASKGYVDSVAIAGSPDASTSTKGISKMSVSPASASNPISVGDNDPRVPTQSENDAMVGYGNTAVSGTNPFVLKDRVKFGGNGSDSALNISSGTTSYDLGGAAVFTKNFTSISITGTANVTFTNPNANGTIIIFKSQGNVTITSSAAAAIDTRGMGAAVGSAARSNIYITAGVGSGTTASTPATGLITRNTKQVILYCGGSSVAGTSGNGVSADGQGGAGGSNIENNGSNGAASSGNTPGTGTPGAAQRGAGALMIECGGAYSCSGTINAGGTAGGNASGTAAGGAGGSAGASLVIMYNVLTSDTGTYTVAGGSGGSKTGFSGLGGAGAAGVASVGFNTEFA